MHSRDIYSCFVTGGTGFIGSHLVDHLLEKGCTVRCLIRDRSRPGWLEGKRVELVDGDLDSAHAIRDACSGADAVFHVAGVTSAGSWREYRSVNGGGCRKVAEAAMAAQDRPGLFLYVSSLAAVGPGLPGEAVTERKQPAPITSYGRSKLEGEKLLAAMNGLPLVIVRPPAVYGPRDREILPLFRMAVKGVCPIMNSAAQLSLIHVRDLARGIMLAAEQGRLGESYFLAGRDPVRAIELPELFAEALGTKVRGIKVPRPVLGAAAALSETWGRLTDNMPIFNREKVRELTAANWVCSTAKGEKDLAFMAGTDLLAGFRETARWYRDKNWLSGNTGRRR